MTNVAATVAVIVTFPARRPLLSVALRLCSGAPNIDPDDDAFANIDGTGTYSGLSQVTHRVKRAHSLALSKWRAHMCELKAGVQSKIDRVIKAMDRLSAALEKADADPSYNQQSIKDKPARKRSVCMSNI